MNETNRDGAEDQDLRSVVATARQVAEGMRQLRAELREAAAKAEADVAREEAARKKAVLGERVERRRKQRRTWLVLAFDVAASVLSLVVLHALSQTDRRIQDSLAQNYATTQQQAVTRVRVLCPLYEVLLATASDPSRTSGMTPTQIARSAAAVKVIHDGYVTLGCQPPLP